MSLGCSDPENQTHDFSDVFRGEIGDVAARRRAQGFTAFAGSPLAPSLNLNLVGLALSGGGIRAASFSLGVLQALNAQGCFKRVDYLSTVSGGGYVGTLLTTSLSANEGVNPFGEESKCIADTPVIRHFRDNSRYLFQNGFPSVISAVGSYLRGLILAIITVLPLLLIASSAILYADQMRSWAMPGAGAMDVTILAGIGIFAIWMLYSIGVSIFPLLPLSKRRLVAAIAGWLLFALCLSGVIEFHVYIIHSPAIDLGKGSSARVAGAVDTVATWWPLVGTALPLVHRLSEWVLGNRSKRRSVLAKRAVGAAALGVLAIILPLGLWATLIKITGWGASPSSAPAALSILFMSPLAQAVSAPLRYLLYALPFLSLWPFMSVNSNSLHQLYRDRLSRVFLVARPPGGGEPDDFKLTDLDPVHAPYHLVNAALNVPGSKVANMRGRNAEFFLFSRRFVGSCLTGFVSTRKAETAVDRLTIGTAMAISGAAAAPNMGIVSVKLLSPTLAFLNFRLGRWFEHPSRIARVPSKPTVLNAIAGWYLRRPHPRFLLREAFFKTGLHLGPDKTYLSVQDRFLYLTDGGHIENLGIYELLRRRCRLIIAIDAEADPGLKLPSFSQLQRLAQIDMGVSIRMDWRPIAAATTRVKRDLEKGRVERDHGPHIAVGLIDYPRTDDSDAGTGALIYVKASLTGDEPDYVLKYAADNTSFPHETTADQLFSEEQLEVYRALGAHAMERFLTGTDAFSCDSAHRQLATTVIEDLLENADLSRAVQPTPATPQSQEKDDCADAAKPT